jgi:short-subunit dehydrogenase
MRANTLPRGQAMPSIKGKTVIVTGASAGVGEATAKLCVREGANVVLAARDRKALDALAAALGPRSRAVVTDVSKHADCEALMKAALEAFGRIDGLVNNAGYNSRGTVEAVALEDIERIIEVNLKAPIRLSKLVLPHLRASGGGAIVNVASLAGRVPLDHEATYSASKFGLRGFSFAMAEELAGSGITVSVVSPGPIETGFILNDIAEVPDMVFSQPMATADEVARAIVSSLEDGKRERVMNFTSGLLAHIVYLAPSIRTALKPSLEAKGRKAKERYLAAKRK